MEPPERKRPTAKLAAAFRTKPGKGEVKVSVVNICGPSSADIMGQIYQHTTTPAKSRYPVLLHKPRSHGLLISSRETGKVPDEPQTPTPMLQIGTCLVYRTRVGKSGQLLTGKLGPLCISEDSGPKLDKCQDVQPQHKEIQKTPDD